MMTRRRDVLKWSAAAALAALCDAAPRSARAESSRLALIVARTSPLQELTRFELKKLYLGAHIVDPSGQRIIPFHQASNAPDRLAFEEKVLGMSGDQMASYWIDRKIRGQSGAPKAVGSPDLVQKVISKVEHSISYVRLEQVRPEVRVIAIDGKLPTDAAYQLLIGHAAPYLAFV